MRSTFARRFVPTRGPAHDDPDDGEPAGDAARGRADPTVADAEAVDGRGGVGTVARGRAGLDGRSGVDEPEGRGRAGRPPAGPRAPGRVGGVAVRAGRRDPDDGVASALGAQLGLVEAAIRGALGDTDEAIAGTFDYVLARDRSRLRARLVLLAAAAVGGAGPPRPAVITGAAAVELLHLAQRHHDTRHVDARQAGEADVLVGDHLMARAVQLAIAVDAAAGEALGRCVVARVRGQLLDDRDRYCVERLTAAYTESCRARTAVLTATAAALGARLAGATRAEVAALRTYGCQLGLALQLTDDLRDVVTDAPDTGDDLRTGVYTLPTLAAAHEAGELRAVLGRPLDKAALAHATQVVRRSGGVALALSQVHRHVTEASGALEGLPAAAGLGELVHGVGHRAWQLAADQPVVDLPRRR